MSGFEPGGGRRVADLLYGDPAPSDDTGPEDGVIVLTERTGYPGNAWLCPACYVRARSQIAVIATGPEFEGHGRPGLGVQCLECPRLFGEVLECS